MLGGDPVDDSMVGGPWPFLEVVARCDRELERKVNLLREKADVASNKYVFRLQMQFDQLESDLEDKKTKLEILEDMKILASDAEKVRVSC